MKKERKTTEQNWRHPGGKLIELGADKLSDAELLSILIGSGTKGKSAEQIANEIIRKFGGYKGMANQPLEKFLEFKGMGDVKIIRIAASFEIARRIVNKVVQSIEPQVKAVIGNEQENYIVCNGRLYRALTKGFKTPDGIDDWIGNNKESVQELEKTIEKHLSVK